MAETPTPVPPTPPTPEPAKPADATVKKQTVRISLPPKPAGGPAIKIPTTGQQAAPAAGGAKVTQVIQAPIAPPAKPSVGVGQSPAAASGPSAAPAKAPAPPPRPMAPAGPAVNTLDLALAGATVLVAIVAILRLVVL